MLVANILGLFIPRFTNPALSSAEIALLTLVSTSLISSHPAALAISSEEMCTFFLLCVTDFIAFQTWLISLSVSLV